MISSPLLRSAYVAFGANLGDVEETYKRVHAKLQSLSEGRQVRASTLRFTQPVGGPPAQPPYGNGCFEILGGPPHDVLFDKLMDLERQFGRTRSEPWAPRTIDLDLLLANEFVGRPDIDVPHPRLHYRRFVLEPLVELTPRVIHPWLLRTSAELLELASLPNPTMLLIGPDRDLIAAAMETIRSRLPTATYADYPQQANRPIFMPIQKRAIATVASLALMPLPAFDSRSCWVVLLGEVDHPIGPTPAAAPLPTFDARAATPQESLQQIHLFLDSLGIGWSTA